MHPHPTRAAFSAIVATLLLAVPACVFAATFVSDTYSGNSVGHFRYVGRWEHVRQMRDGRVFGSSSRTADAGASVTLDFIGSVVRVYGVRGPGGGHGTVTVDDGSAVGIDFYSPTKAPRTLIYHSALLPAGKHSITIEATGGVRTPGHHSSYINISGATYK